MIYRLAILPIAALGLLAATPAAADEIYGGIYAHGVDTPFTLKTYEEGADIQLGYRFDEVDALAPIGRPEPYFFASVNTASDTNYAGAGVSWKIEAGPVYVRPGVGLVAHDAPSLRVDEESGRRTDLGSRILFAPEIAVGAQVTERLSIEASWVHISNARLFNSRQNPGIDSIGLRLNFAL